MKVLCHEFELKVLCHEFENYRIFNLVTILGLGHEFEKKVLVTNLRIIEYKTWSRSRIIELSNF